MSGFIPILIYMAALAIPAWLLYHFGSESWFWHALAIFAGLLLGFMPMPVLFSQPGYDLMIGFAFISLMVWGIGGLFMIRPHREKHA
jgi:hypothetical protein